MRRLRQGKGKAGRTQRPTINPSGFTIDFWARIKTSEPSAVVNEIKDAGTAAEILEALPSDYEHAKEVISALYSRFPEKAVAKAARKAAFRLREKGISLEALGLTSEPHETRPRYRDELKALLGPIHDLNGTRLVLVIRDSALRGLELGMGMASRKEGLRDFALRPVSKKGFAALLDSFNSSLGPIVEIEMAVLVRILEDAFAIGDLGRTDPVSYNSMRSMLLKAAPPVERLFLEQRDIAAKEDMLISEKDTSELMSTPPLDQWMPDAADVEKYEAQIKSFFQSPLLLSQLSKEEREKRLRTELAVGIFDTDARNRLKEILYETAYYFGKATKDGATSALARRAAYTMEKTPTCETNPILDLLIKRGIDNLTERFKEESKEGLEASQSRIIIAP